jgi:hypothetical protein
MAASARRQLNSSRIFEVESELRALCCYREALFFRSIPKDDALGKQTYCNGSAPRLFDSTRMRDESQILNALGDGNVVVRSGSLHAARRGVRRGVEWRLY